MLDQDLHNIALASVPSPNGKKELIKAHAITDDIIKEILSTFQSSYKQTKDFAPEFESDTTLESARKVWRYIRKNIRYQLDPFNHQYIKTPSATINDGYSDCKGYTILALSILKNLGYPVIFRFVSFTNKPVFTHVYPVTRDKHRRGIILDPCLKEFNKQKRFTHKQDFDMTQIYKISGIGNASNGVTAFRIDPTMLEGELDLLLAREQLELERAIDQRRGVISGFDEDRNLQIELINEALRNIDKPERIMGIGATVSGFDDDAGYEDVMAGIYGRKEKRKARRAKRKAEGKGFFRKVGNFFGKVGKGILKGAKAIGKGVLKVVTAPARLVIKGILEVKLPKSAPYFLPLFATDQQASQLPSQFQKERNRAKKRADFIVNGIGMKRNHFMKIVRNGIMKQKGRKPEEIIMGMINKGVVAMGEKGAQKIAGIGSVYVGNPVAVLGILKPLFDILKKIGKIFKKKDPDAEDNSETLLFDETNAIDTPIFNDSGGVAYDPIEEQEYNFGNDDLHQSNQTIDPNTEPSPQKSGNNLPLILAAGAALYFMSEK